MRRRLIAGAAAAGAGLGLRAAAARAPESVERFYARGVYPWIVAPLARLTAPLPFSLAELVVAAASLLALAALARFGLSLRRARRETAPAAEPRPGEAALPPRLARVASGLTALGFALYLVFLLLWGLNYQRESLARSLDLDARPAPAAELVALSRELVQEAGRLRVGLAEDREGVMRLKGGWRLALGRAEAGYVALGARRALFGGRYGPPKPVLASPLLSSLGITGLYFPFTGEANVNLDVPDATLPFTACHELAHQHGFAREDEANYVGYLAGRAHPDPDFRYSAAFEAAVETLSALRAVEPEPARGIVVAAAPGVRRDWARLAEWLRRHAGPARRVSYALNDAYLRSQGQAEGVRSYGRMVDLLLAARRQRVRNGFNPDRPTAPSGP